MRGGEVGNLKIVVAGHKAERAIASLCLRRNQLHGRVIHEQRHAVQCCCRGSGGNSVGQRNADAMTPMRSKLRGEDITGNRAGGYAGTDNYAIGLHIEGCACAPGGLAGQLHHDCGCGQGRREIRWQQVDARSSVVSHIAGRVSHSVGAAVVIRRRL